MYFIILLIMHLRLFAALLLTVALFQCSAQTPVKSIVHSKSQSTFLLDSTEAATTILVDRYDRFFERATAVEMSIQIQQPLNPKQTREDQVARFKSFLQADMASFTPEESQWIAGIMKKIYDNCSALAPDIFPDSIVLIKTHGKHYGDGVYYTRGKYIIIPANELRRRDRAAFTSTMYHEVFHVYSRLHPEKRRQLYQLIGFQHIGTESLDVPPTLAQRVLHNPDGVDFGQMIHLRTEKGDSIMAIPIIYANQHGYKENQSSFFQYLEFNLFEVKALPNGRWKVICSTDGLSSTLNLAQLPDFYTQIRDNTTYIIHPDEVLADNFSFIMLDKEGKQVSAKFSKEGKKLLKLVEAILKA
jgi:hypothetical protein